MRTLIYLSALAILLAFANCTKTAIEKPQATDYDIVNSVFRIIIATDADYTLRILEIKPNGANGPDTVRNLKATGVQTFNYGFTPASGNKLVLSATSSKGTKLDCTLAFKGARLGIDSVYKANNQLVANYTYVVSADGQ